MLDHLGGRNRTETQGLFETKASRLAEEESRFQTAMSATKSGYEARKVRLGKAYRSSKEQALAKTSPRHSRPGRYKPGDQLLRFLNNL